MFLSVYQHHFRMNPHTRSDLMSTTILQSSAVGTGLVGAPACGDVMKLQIRVNEETGVVEEAVFKVSLPRNP